MLVTVDGKTREFFDPGDLEMFLSDLEGLDMDAVAPDGAATDHKHGQSPPPWKPTGYQPRHLRMGASLPRGLDHEGLHQVVAAFMKENDEEKSH
ncbi:hypothetical protein NDU88_010021 [Pleurodeles waltl]|uniref:Uncharacterized protein n=1 Tax=Pleurodeles waltl TaxID=8319 RepID=A0AAV7RXS8_PLEWA|nr:hypothetical protein NDU88_010021 [Pleurodeles waltl]